MKFDLQLFEEARIKKPTRTQIFGKNLERIRKEKGVTRQQLAEAVRITEIAVGQYERGINAPNFERLFEIADFLQVSVASLTGENDFNAAFVDANKIIFEYRYERILKLSREAKINIETAKRYGVEGFIVSIPTLVKAYNTDGVIEAIPTINTFKIKDKKSLVDIFEIAEINSIRENIKFVDSVLKQLTP